MPFSPPELAAEHARAMRIVKAVLNACDARAATARAARSHGLTDAEGRWVLSIGKAAIGMAEGIKDVCGEPDRHLIVTVDGPAVVSLSNVLRSDHPLPTKRSLDAGQAVKRFIEEAKPAGAPSLTVLISGGASSLICEPIPGIDLDDYRDVVSYMLTAGWDIHLMNTVRRAIDELKGGGLARVAAPLPIDLLVISDVIGNALHDIGSGPFVVSPTLADDARGLLADAVTGVPNCDRVLVALSCHPRGDTPPRPRREIVALENAAAVFAATAALDCERFDTVSVRMRLTCDADTLSRSAKDVIDRLGPHQSLVWGGEWPRNHRRSGVGGRCQYVASSISRYVHWRGVKAHIIALATDGVDGVAPPGRPTPAGAYFFPGMSEAPVRSGAEIEDAGKDYRDALERYKADPHDDLPLFWWYEDNIYHNIAHRDKHRRPEEPPAHIFTGPTGTNVNDLLIAWRVK